MKEEEEVFCFVLLWVRKIEERMKKKENEEERE
jgi:hypothetical protein